MNPIVRLGDRLVGCLCQYVFVPEFMLIRKYHGVFSFQECILDDYLMKFILIYMSDQIRISVLKL
ncbi:hypothetical protein GLYMA_02G054100v4 [Glycine max]|uniref:Uncharacterized protein n=1 Tax=Glycine max TaxID=3847 RepID=A0A0R0KXQ6_SOYBN|nr:hypothetical protein JHK87_003101 [Glycine soja]KAG5062238.1 hypothetical protein JHK85_003421 [Glycine max]KAG5079190.1 hypothetical protein JHK86_003255 [Glycine max]KRH69874.1 hypothetical protein GLYMA_02G054100v4 [Glycine max]